ncbi:MAG: DUF3160 domain-containing protein [Candidatus Eisenbacteria bacterium]|nr:DUF3160 domain-containing protein [Candidatus Eisenbacteria bacterium]
MEGGTKRNRSVYGLVLLAFLTAGFQVKAIGQTGDFDIDAYKQFLSEHQDLTSAELLQSHPAGLFHSQANLTPSTIHYLDSIDVKYRLTDYEKSLIRQHDFMVTERLSYPSFGHAFLDVWREDLPVFISTDAILHALHMSYDRILCGVEVEILVQELGSLLEQLHSQLPTLASRYASNPEMKLMLKDVDVYLTIPRKLLGQTVSPYYPENQATATQLLSLIQAEQPVDFPLFASKARSIDFSQFKLRGHYTSKEYPQLAGYFKSMMWLGRTEIYLLPPRSLSPTPTDEDIRRQTIDVALISEAAQLANALPLLEEIDSIIRFFVGEQDNVTLPNIQEVLAAANITSANQLLNTANLRRFQDTLITKSYAFQRILSQILMNDPMNPDSIIPASSFLLLGQRFVIDSYITGQVVFDKILYRGIRVPRMLPSALDVLFALGNNASAQLLQSELDTYNYGSNLAAVRYLVDHYDQEFWNSTLFNLWLSAIRSLSPPMDREGLPSFMKTAAWWQEKMNTQLASWAELRHDNLLCAKQSYTGSVICSYPYSYVEPIPEFYDAVGAFAQIAEDKFQNINFPNELERRSIVDYFSMMHGVADTLSSIASKELSNMPLSSAEMNFLRQMLFTVSGCGASYRGWYPRLFFRDYGSGGQLLKSDHLVADIHTAPTDPVGNPVGWVLHVGTGPVDLGVFVAQLPGHEMTAFVGPVMSYHEYLTTNFLRLSDEEWKASYLFNSTRPSWVNLYLADGRGESKGSGLCLFASTGVDSGPTPEPTKKLPETLIVHKSFPNPFSSSTVIGFAVPQTLGDSYCELTIYNLKGQAVKRLLGTALPAANYLTRWDATDEDGRKVSNGVYLYRLKIGTSTITGKMSFIK